VALYLKHLQLPELGLEAIVSIALSTPFAPECTVHVDAPSRNACRYPSGGPFASPVVAPSDDMVLRHFGELLIAQGRLDPSVRSLCPKKEWCVCVCACVWFVCLGQPCVVVCAVVGFKLCVSAQTDLAETIARLRQSDTTGSTAGPTGVAADPTPSRYPTLHSLNSLSVTLYLSGRMASAVPLLQDLALFRSRCRSPSTSTIEATLSPDLPPSPRQLARLSQYQRQQQQHQEQQHRVGMHTEFPSRSASASSNNAVREEDLREAFMGHTDGTGTAGTGTVGDGFVGADMARMASYEYGAAQAQGLGPSHCGDGVHVVLQYYRPPLPRRQQELQACLAANLDNPMVAKVHVLTEEQLDMTADMGGTQPCLLSLRKVCANRPRS